MVAGPGFEPGPSDYEPDEVPFLYPALLKYSKNNCIDKLPEYAVVVKTTDETIELNFSSDRFL